MTDQISRCSAASVRTHRGDRIGVVREGGHRAGRPPLPPPWCRSRHSPLGSSPASPMASLGSFPGIWEGPAAAADEAERSCCGGGVVACWFISKFLLSRSQHAMHRQGWVPLGLDEILDEMHERPISRVPLLPQGFVLNLHA